MDCILYPPVYSSSMYFSITRFEIIIAVNVARAPSSKHAVHKIALVPCGVLIILAARNLKSNLVLIKSFFFFSF